MRPISSILPIHDRTVRCVVVSQCNGLEYLTFHDLNFGEVSPDEGVVEHSCHYGRAFEVHKSSLYEKETRDRLTGTSSTILFNYFLQE